jgi:tetratricopeptide (TPR) repeat protein
VSVRVAEQERAERVFLDSLFESANVAGNKLADALWLAGVEVMTSHKRLSRSVSLFACVFVFLQLSWAQSPVKVWNAPLELPTYKIGPPDLEPMFYAGRDYQGAQGRIYPYPLYDNLLDVRGSKTYQADYLENQYVKICILPQLGGRIFSATDKTDDYDFVYRQTEIKPALIGMLGAWISGGVEWNIPHHHRATSYLPVDHRLVENPDGSSTIWVGEVELRHRMQWAVGITLFPDKSYVRITTKLFNRTPFVHSFLDFTNTGVHANKNYQVIFPPDTQFAVYHAKVQFAHWPISHEIYQGVDYTRGVDLSWWKNHPTPVSFFAWNFDGDFFGGYDHGKEAGIICVEDHNVSPGAKFFEWGNGPEGTLWDKILDSQGDYLELMAGNFSDNQPDYSWIQPFETKSATQYWFPIRGIGGAKNANLNGAVNLELAASGEAQFGFSTTQEFRGAKAVLTAGHQTLYEQSIDIAPDQPFAHNLALPAGVKADDLEVSLLDSHGQELISYHPAKRDPEPMPPTVKPPLPPREIKSVDELYLTGLRLEQFHSAVLEPYPYYEEALRRDPGNYNVNTALGRLYCGRGLWEPARERLAAALNRATHNYTPPKDGEAYYYLGVTLRGEGKNLEAEDAFHRASWSEAWTAASYYQLAELHGQKSDWPQALSDLNHSLDYNSLNCQAWDLTAAALRKLGRKEEARKAAKQALAENPLDPWAIHELGLLGANHPAVSLGDSVQSNLELAVTYYDSGLTGESQEILKGLVAASPDQRKVNPLIYYWLGYLAIGSHQADEASRCFQLAAQMSTDYVFPFRLETAKVLEAAMKANPADAHAPFYLGNLLYDRQHEAAIQLWEKSAEIDGSFALVHRNLAGGYEQVEHNTAAAIASMGKALSLDKNNARYLYELDVLLEAGNVAPQKRLELFESHAALADKRSDAMMQEAKVYLLTGHYDQAIQLLTTHRFRNWEGYGDIHDVYADACLLRGESSFRKGKFQDALKDYAASLEYPENLEVAQPHHEGRLPQVNYLMASADEKLGNAAKSQELLQQAARGQETGTEQGPPEALYYRGLAELNLGRKNEANLAFAKLVANGNKALTSKAGLDYFAKFGQRQSDNFRLAEAHYLIGLGELGKGEKETARTEFQQALKLNINHLGATTQLANLAH